MYVVRTINSMNETVWFRKRADWGWLWTYEARWATTFIDHLEAHTVAIDSHGEVVRIRNAQSFPGPMMIGEVYRVTDDR